MDPELIGADPVWTLLRTGKGHIYYSCIGIVVLSIAIGAGAPRWLEIIVAALAGGVFADCWAHQVLH